MKRSGCVRTPQHLQEQIPSIDQVIPRGLADTLPSRLDYRPLMQQPRDQGEYPTCVAFAASAIREVQRSVFSMNSGSKKKEEYLSPSFIYFLRKAAPLYQTTQGMYPVSACRILCSFDQVLETELEYSDSIKQDKSVRPSTLGTFMKNNVKTSFTSLAKTKCRSYVKISTNNGSNALIQGIKTALYANGPVMVCMDVYDYDRYDFWKGSNPNPEYHAVACVGYDDDKQHFIIRNSWGYTEWPVSLPDGTRYGGYTFLPYREVKYIQEAYSLVDGRLPIGRTALNKNMLPTTGGMRSVRGSTEELWKEAEDKLAEIEVALGSITLDTIEQAIVEEWNELKDDVEHVAEVIHEKVKTVKDKVMNMKEVMSERLSKHADQWKERMARGDDDVVQDVVDSFGDVLDTVGDTFGDAVFMVGDVVSDMADTIGDTIQDTVQHVMPDVHIQLTHHQKEKENHTMTWVVLLAIIVVIGYYYYQSQQKK